MSVYEQAKSYRSTQVRAKSRCPLLSPLSQINGVYQRRGNDAFLRESFSEEGGLRPTNTMVGHRSRKVRPWRACLHNTLKSFQRGTALSLSGGYKLGRSGKVPLHTTYLPIPSGPHRWLEARKEESSQLWGSGAEREQRSGEKPRVRLDTSGHRDEQSRLVLTCSDSPAISHLSVQYRFRTYSKKEHSRITRKTKTWGNKGTRCGSQLSWALHAVI